MNFLLKTLPIWPQLVRGILSSQVVIGVFKEQREPECSHSEFIRWPSPCPEGEERQGCKVIKYIYLSTVQLSILYFHLSQILYFYYNSLICKLSYSVDLFVLYKPQFHNKEHSTKTRYTYLVYVLYSIEYSSKKAIQINHIMFHLRFTQRLNCCGGFVRHTLTTDIHFGYLMLKWMLNSGLTYL